MEPAKRPAVDNAGHWAGTRHAVGVGEVKLTGMARPDRKVLTYEIGFTKAI